MRSELEPLTSQLVYVEDQKIDYVKTMEAHATHLLQTMEDVVDTFRKAILFMLMKVRPHVFM